MIETVCSDSDVSINKLDAILGVYNQVFEMTVDDQLMLVNIVNFLHQNKTFVYKKVPFSPLLRLLNGLSAKRLIFHLTLLVIKYKCKLVFFKLFCCVITYNKMNKYTLIKQKRDQAISRRQTKISRRTFPPSIFQLNSIIAPEVVPPDIITEIELTEEVEVIIQDQPIEKIELLEEPIILLPENWTMSTNPIIESPIEIKPDVVDLVILSQSEDIRKLLLLKETIKRFSKKKIV